MDADQFSVQMQMRSSETLAHVKIWVFGLQVPPMSSNDARQLPPKLVHKAAQLRPPVMA
jgi:hypothetical protein